MESNIIPPSHWHFNFRHITLCYVFHHVGNIKLTKKLKSTKQHNFISTYAQKSSTVLKVVMTFWLSSQLFRLSFLKYHRAQVFCSGCLMSCSGSTAASVLVTASSSSTAVSSVSFVNCRKKTLMLVTIRCNIPFPSLLFSPIPISVLTN